MNISQEFNDSYERINSDAKGFYTRFYELFTDSSPAVREVFQSVDMERQRDMMEASLLSLISSIGIREDSSIKALAERHHSIRGVTPEMYDQWLEAMVATVKELDPKFSPDVEAAWRAILLPSLEYMKRGK